MFKKLFCLFLLFIPITSALACGSTVNYPWYSENFLFPFYEFIQPIVYFLLLIAVVSGLLIIVSSKNKILLIINSIIFILITILLVIYYLAFFFDPKIQDFKEDPSKILYEEMC